VRPKAKVTIDSLYEVVYEKSIGRNMTDLDLCCLEVVEACQPLRHIHYWIYPKPSEISAWFQWTTN